MTGGFDEEIVPVTTRFQEVEKEGNKAGEMQTITVTKDDDVRRGVTTEQVSQPEPAFQGGGTSTAGNSSQVSGGAAAVLLTTRYPSRRNDWEGHILGKYFGSAVVGCEPCEMGSGPALAVPKLLEQFNLEVRDIARWELNEAFASQRIYCLRRLGLKMAWEAGDVNPDGGAIALGHPLGATGARLVTTLLHGLQRIEDEDWLSRRLGVTTMCIGTGMYGDGYGFVVCERVEKWENGCGS